MRRRDPSRRSLPVVEWPAADQAAWRSLLEPGDILDDYGAGAHWAPSTRTGILQSLRPVAGLAHARASKRLAATGPRARHVRDHRRLCKASQGDRGGFHGRADGSCIWPA